VRLALGVETRRANTSTIEAVQKGMEIRWTSYLQFRANLRGFDLNALEGILRNSSERYTGAATGRRVAIGKHGNTLVAIPDDQNQDVIVPVTVHTTSRQQVTYRLKSGRFVYE
jgi:hypothetical protein